MIDFAKGHPNSSLLPREESLSALAELCQALGESNADTVRSALQYGNENGNPDFLDELHAFIDRQSKDDDFGELQTNLDHQTRGDEESRSVSHNSRLFVTAGVSHGIELLCATQTQAGDVVLVERPTYFLVGGIFQSHSLVIRGLPMHASTGGVNVDKLVELVETGMMNVPRMIYIIPTHQNPTGHTMPIEDRIKLASFALRNGILVVCDEVYHLLDWRNVATDGPRPARMASLSELVRADHDYPCMGGCVSVSSFTKIFAPGVRLGWIEGQPYIIDSLANYGYIQSQGGCAPFMGELMRMALANRVADDVLRKLRMKYKIRSEILACALKVETRIQVFNHPVGGYFMWIKFPDYVRAEDFLEFCEGRVKFMLGTRCDIVADGRDDAFSSHARLCFSDLDLPALETGIAELISCFCRYIQSLPPREGRVTDRS